MLGLVVLLFIGAYLLVSALVVWLAVRWARRHNRRAWVWGSLAAFAMYNLVFWDWIPTVAMHKYYCATEAGFWVYKTPEQWAKENPGVLETLKPYPKVKWRALEIDGGTVDQYNDRFGFWSKSNTDIHGLLIDRHEVGIVDLKTHEFLTRYTYFLSGPGGAGVIWKSWLNRRHGSDCLAVSKTVSNRQIAKQLNMGDI